MPPEEFGRWLGRRRNAAYQTPLETCMAPGHLAPGRPAASTGATPAGRIPSPPEVGQPAGQRAGLRWSYGKASDVPAAGGIPSEAQKVGSGGSRTGRLPAWDPKACQIDHTPGAPRAPLSLIQREQLVNPLSSHAFRQAERTVKASEKVDSARRWLAATLQTLGDPWLERRGKAMADCERHWKVAVLKSDPTRSKPMPVNHCTDRLCPACARIRAHKWAERTAPILDEVRKAGGVPKMLTLTQVTKPGESLVRARQRFERAFRRLYRDPRYRSRVRGWMASREVTWSEGAWHYHAHVLVDCEFWPQKDIAGLWLELTGDSSIVDIRRARAGSEREIVKYAVKVLTVPAEKLQELAMALRGARMVSTGGAWKNAVREADLEPTDEAPEGYELWSVEKLMAGVRAGDRTAQLAAAACLRWLEERGGTKAVGWFCEATDPDHPPRRVPRADELERGTAGALESRGGGWVRAK